MDYSDLSWMHLLVIALVVLALVAVLSAVPGERSPVAPGETTPKPVIDAYVDGGTPDCGNRTAVYNESTNYVSCITATPGSMNETRTTAPTP